MKHAKEGKVYEVPQENPTDPTVLPTDQQRQELEEQPTRDRQNTNLPQAQ